MLFNDNIETIELDITDMEALKLRERELERGAFKVDIKRVHSTLIRLEVFTRPQHTIIDVTPTTKRMN